MTVAPPLFERVALIGLGLIAGSMAHAMREGGLAGRITGHARSAETREIAREIGLVDEVFATAAEAVRDADLVGLGRDQALVNGVLDGEWTEISPLWNWQFTWASAHLTAMADPCLIHFIGPEKPWLARSAGIVPMRYRAPYADLPGAGAGLTRRAWPDRRRLGRALLRQWRASGPMLDYLGRFADEYTLIDPR